MISRNQSGKSKTKNGQPTDKPEAGSRSELLQLLFVSSSLLLQIEVEKRKSLK